MSIQSLDFSRGRCRPVSLGKLGVTITRFVSTQYGGDRALGRLAPMLSLVPDLHDWGRRDKHQLVRFIRAKGARSEAESSRLSARNGRLRSALDPYAV